MSERAMASAKNQTGSQRLGAIVAILGVFSENAKTFVENVRALIENIATFKENVVALIENAKTFVENVVLFKEKLRFLALYLQVAQ